MSGYFEALASRGAGLAPASQPFIAPRRLPRFDTAGLAAAPGAGLEIATGERHAAAATREDPIGRAPARGQHPWETDALDREPSRNVGGARDEGPERSQPLSVDPIAHPDTTPPDLSLLLPAAATTPMPPTAATIAASPMRMPPLAALDTAAKQSCEPSPQSTTRDQTAVSRSAQDARVDSSSSITIHPGPPPTHAAAVSRAAARLPALAQRDEGREDHTPPPVMLTIGRIDVTVEPPVAPSSGSSGRQRSRGFASYSRARRGELR